MTISSANNKSGPYNGNGVTTAFSGTFKIFDEAHVQVIATDAAGAETVKTLTTHYTVSGVGGSGFTVTMLAAPALGTKITLIRDVPFTQEVDLENQGAYFAEVVEQALDAAVSRDQQLQEQVSRSVKIPASADLAALDTLIASIVLLGDSADDLAGLAAISADLETLAAINAQISTVAGISGAVSSVSAISTQVQAVAAVDDELLDIHADLAALLAVPAAAAASASAASGSATAAAASAVAAAASAASVTPLPNQVVASAAKSAPVDADLLATVETAGPTLKKTTWLQAWTGYFKGKADALYRTLTQSREMLTADRTYYVRTDGNDNNDGLANTSGGAKLTIQAAINAVASLDLSIYNVTIQVGNGTYTAGATVSGPWVGSGTVTLRGDPTTPSNVLISTSGHCVRSTNSASIEVAGIKFASSGAAGVFADAAGFVKIAGKCDFGACGHSHVWATTNGRIAFGTSVPVLVSGAAPRHIFSDAGGVITGYLQAYTISGTPNFSAAWCTVTNGTVVMDTMTISGSATGKRYEATLNGTVLTYGGGANYFPGNAAGTTATGGQYA